MPLNRHKFLNYFKGNKIKKRPLLVSALIAVGLAFISSSFLLLRSHALETVPQKPVITTPEQALARATAFCARVGWITSDIPDVRKDAESPTDWLVVYQPADMKSPNWYVNYNQFIRINSLTGDITVAINRALQRKPVTDKAPLLSKKLILQRAEDCLIASRETMAVRKLVRCELLKDKTTGKKNFGL